MKILVTGGGGFLGQALCRALRGRGHEVVSFQRRHSPELAALGVGQVRGDLADANAVMHAAAGVDARDGARVPRMADSDRPNQFRKVEKF